MKKSQNLNSDFPLNKVNIKDVRDSDLDIFFQHQQDLDAQYMAAFIHKNPTDRTAFDSHWKKMMKDITIMAKTIYLEEEVVGHIAKFVMFDKPEITYWIGKEVWGKGIATQAVRLFLEQVTIRPIYARAAKDNVGSICVLEKNGFTIIGYDKGFANAREKEIDDVVMKLK